MPGDPRIEDARKHEVREKPSREQVLQTFNDTLGQMKDAPDLLPNEKRELERIEKFVERTLDHPKGSRLSVERTYRHPDNPDWRLRTNEGIPVDGMIDYLTRVIDSDDVPKKKKEELIKQRAVLAKNSVDYRRGKRAEPANWLLVVKAYAKEEGIDDLEVANGELLLRLELSLPPTKEEMDILRDTGSLDEARFSAGIGIDKLPPAPTGEEPTDPSTPPAEPTPPGDSPDRPPPAPEPTPREPVPPTIDDIRADQLSVMIGAGDVSLETLARHKAEVELEDRIQPDKRFFKRVWYRWTREFYVQKWTKQALEAMRASGTSAVSLSFGRKAAEVLSTQTGAMEATVKSIKERLELGSMGKRFDEKVTEAEGLLRQDILDSIINPVVGGERLTKEEVQKRLSEIMTIHKDEPAVREVFGSDEAIYGKLSEFYATDILEMANLLRTHEKSLEWIDEHVKVKMTNMGWAGGKETGDKLSWTDRLIRRGQKSRILAPILSPTVVGALTSIGTALALRAPAKALSVAGHIAVPGAGMISGGFLAAWRRNFELKVDRRLQSEQRKYGAEIPIDAKRRMRMESFAYDTVTAESLLNGYVDRDGVHQPGIRQLRGGLETEEGRESLVKKIIEIEERIDYSLREQKGLIRYSSETSVAQEQTALLKECVEMRQALREVGFSDERINLVAERQRASFNQNIQESDAAFGRYRLKESLKSGGIGAVAGLAAGVVGHELWTEGLHWAGVGGGSYAREVVGGGGGKINPDTLHDLYAKGGSLPLENNLEIRVNPANHHVLLIDSTSGKPVSVDAVFDLQKNGHIYVEGKLPDELQDQLQEAGLRVNEGPKIDGVKIVEEPGRGMNEVVGHKTSIPKGTEWIQNPNDPTKWDLVEKGHPKNVYLNDAQFDGAGRLTSYDVAGSSAKVELAEVVTKREIAVGEVAAAELDKYGTNVGHREWYGYNTPYSERNELTAYNAIFDSANGQKGVVWDMSHMQLGYQDGLNPNPIDVQQVIRDGQAGFAFSIPGHEGTPVWVPDGADGVFDGRVILDPSDMTHKINPFDPNSITIGELSQKILNQNALQQAVDGNIAAGRDAGYLASELTQRQNVFNLGLNGKMGYIEAGRMLPGENGNVFQVFATGRGSTDVQFDIIKEVQTTVNLTREVPIKIPTYDLTPFDREIFPIIPFPFAPRYPLERLGPTIITPAPFPYYSGYTKQQLRDWLQEDPRRHQPVRKIKVKDAAGKEREVWVDVEGKPLDRRVEREREVVSTYLDSIRTSDPTYYAELERLAAEPTMPAMGDDTRVVINIPAWMEGKGIYKALDEYSRQLDKDGNPLSTDLYEINILVNRKTGSAPDETLSEIQRFIADARAKGLNPRINFLDVEFDPPLNVVGNARKVMTDLSLIRSLRRPTQEKALYIESEDADLVHVDQKTVINIIDKMDNNPHLDAVRGVQDRFPEEMMENDLVFLARRMQDFSELFMRRKKLRPENNPDSNFQWHRVITGGWNTAYSAEAYALVGGYDRGKEMGEDLLIGEKLSMIRGDGVEPNLDVIGRVHTRTDSSPRRFIGEVMTGENAYSKTFTDEELNRIIKTTPISELMEMISPFARLSGSNWHEFQRIMDAHYRWVSSLSSDKEIGKEVFADVMGWLGFKKDDFAFTQAADGEHLAVTNWENVKDALEDYRTRHTRPRKRGERTRHERLAEAPATVPTPPVDEPEPKAPEVPEGKIEFHEFYKKNKLDLSSVTLPDHSLDELKTSKDTFEVGNYVITKDKIAGKGESGKEVLLGYDKTTGKMFAFKQVDKEEQLKLADDLNYPEGIKDPEDVIKAEVGDNSLLGIYKEKIDHGDSVVKVYELSALDLRNLLAQKGGALPPQEALKVAIGVTDALRLSHQAGVVHTDVIDNNILINEDGTVTLTDFHVAAIQPEGQSYTFTGYTEKYHGIMAPELQDKTGVVFTPSLDTYQASILLYRTLTGKFPYGGGSRAEVMEMHKQGKFEIPESVPEPIRKILQKGIQPNPAARYQTAEEMLKDLTEAYNEITTKPPTPAVRPAPKAPESTPPKETPKVVDPKAFVNSLKQGDRVLIHGDVHIVTPHKNPSGKMIYHFEREDGKAKRNYGAEGVVDRVARGEITAAEAKVDVPKPNAEYEDGADIGGFTARERILLHVLAGDNIGVINHYVVEGNRRHIDFKETAEADTEKVKREFVKDPVRVQKKAVDVLRNIMRDGRLSEDQKTERAKAFTVSFLKLVVKLDREAFPPTPGETVMKGIPEYIPDGLTDMGSDPETGEFRSGREKVRIDKLALFEQSTDLLYRMITAPEAKGVTQEGRDKFFVDNVMYYVNMEMPYYFGEGGLNPEHSIPLDYIRESRLSVCRHHALYTQVLLQTLGVKSRLLKTDVVFGSGNRGAHGNNLVEVGGKWYLIDTTNPERIKKNGKEQARRFIKPIPETTIDTSNKNYHWEFEMASGQKRVYTSRNNMYYRIKDNVKDPAFAAA